jgi:hypothetical protein
MSRLSVQMGHEQGQAKRATAGLSQSLAAISRKTKEIDPEEHGVSESAVLTNPDAYAHYKQHCIQPPALSAVRPF